MTPQEKAKKLVWDYYHMLEHTISDEYSKQDWEISKKCVLILVHEILEIESKRMIEGDINEYEYWEEVKEEIENL